MSRRKQPKRTVKLRQPNSGGDQTPTLACASRLERDKAFLDFIRHMATLAGGALGFLAAFVKAGEVLPRRAFQTAVLFFIASLCCQLCAYLGMIAELFGRQLSEISDRDAKAVAGFVTVAMVSIILGFAAIGIGTVWPAIWEW